MALGRKFLIGQYNTALLLAAHLISQLHLAQSPSEPGLPCCASVQAASIVNTDHSVSLASQQVRPVIGQLLEWKLLIGQLKNGGHSLASY